MLIVCPNCATSYMIDPASVGPAGRSVRCARCKTTWFAGGPQKAPEVAAFVDSVIAEAESQTPRMPKAPAPHHAEAKPPQPAPPDADDFGETAEHEDEAPPVSAQPEIVSPPTEPAAPAAASMPSHAEIPAEPVTITDAPSLVPAMGQAPVAPIAESETEDSESFAARRQRLKVRRNEKRRSSRWTAVVLVLFAFNVALVGARSEVVRYLPQTASLFAAIGLPVNLRNLQFENVRISREGEGATTVLIVEGSIVSTGNKAIEVPRLRFAARNAAGQEIYTWTMLPDRSVLGPGENLEFSSRLAAPPSDANDVVVRFFSARDKLPGVN